MFSQGGLPPGAYSGIAVSTESPPQLYICNGSGGGNTAFPSLGAVQIDTTGYPTLSPAGLSPGVTMQLLWLSFADPNTFFLCFQGVGSAAWEVPCDASGSCTTNVYHLPYVCEGSGSPSLLSLWPNMIYFFLNPSVIQPYQATPSTPSYGTLTPLGTASPAEAFAGPNLYAYTMALSDSATFAGESALVWPPQWLWSPAGMSITGPTIHPAAVYNIYMSNGSSTFYLVASGITSVATCAGSSCLVPSGAASATLQAPDSGTRSLLAPASWGLLSTAGVVSWDGSPPPSSLLNGIAESLWFDPAQYTAVATSATRLLPAIPAGGSGGDGVCVFDLTPLAWEPSGGGLTLMFSHRWPFFGTDARILQAEYSSVYGTWSLAYYSDASAQALATVTTIVSGQNLVLGQLARVCLYVHVSDDAMFYYVTLFHQVPCDASNPTCASPNTLSFPPTQWGTATQWLTIPAPQNPIVGSGGKWDAQSEGLALCPPSLFTADNGVASFTVANYTTMTAVQAACQASNNGLRGLLLPQSVGANLAGLPNGWQATCVATMQKLCTQPQSNGTSYADADTCCIYNSSLYKAINAGYGSTTAAQMAGCFSSDCAALTTAYRPITSCGTSQCLTLMQVNGSFNNVSQVTQNTTCRSCATGSGTNPCCAAQPPNTSGCPSPSGGGGTTPSTGRTLAYIALALGLMLIAFLLYLRSRAQQ